MRLRIVVAALLLSSSLLFAQTFRGGLEGTVTDSSGASIQGATVTILNTDTGLTRTVQTADTGDFVFPELPLGNYKLTVTKTGFRTETQTGITLTVSTRPHLDIKLSPGEVKETVEVSAEVPLVDVSGNNMGGTIETKQLQDLPVNGRDFTKMLIMVPGASGDNSGGADSPGSFGLFSLNGNRGRSNNYMLDGTDMNDGYRNLPAINQGGVFGTPATILPVDALAEIPVISNFEAEYGRNSGAIVNMVTKSGTNDIHGSVYEYFRNNGLDARNFFNTKPNPRNVFHNNQFGGSFGGPIIKDRTFFFLAYEGQRENGSVPTENTVPTQGDIAQANCGGALPANVNPVSANVVCVLQPWGPNASLPAGAPGGASVLEATKFTNRVDSVIFKIDQHIGAGDLLTGRYFFGDSDQSFPLGLLGSGATPGYNTVTPTRVQILSLSYTHIITPKLLLEIRGGWNRFNEKFFPQDSSFNPVTALGLNDNVIARDGGLPTIRIGGYAQVGANPSVSRGRVDTNWQYDTNASYTTGKHNLKWGYEFRRTFVNGFFDAGYRGVLNFHDSSVPTRAGNFLNFLYGGNDTVTLAQTMTGHQIAGDSNRYTYQNNHAFYFQDSWRLSPKLTANLGVRWDYFGVIGEKNGNFSLFNFSTSSPAVNKVSQLYPKDFNNFAPRISFAYDVFGTGKTVLRAGYGIFYDAFSQDFFVGQLPWPTFNSGPAYNFVAGDPAAISETFSPYQNMNVTAGPCGAGQVTVPNYTGYCAGPTFQYLAGFGNDTFTVDQRIRTPYVQNWNVNIEQALGNRVSWQIGYVGSKGTKLFRYIDANQECPLNFTSCPSAAGPVAPGSTPYGFPTNMGFGYILNFQSSAGSVYHSLQTSLQMRNFHRISSVINYTWSHSIDNASDGQDYVPDATQPDDSYNPAGERANSNFDQRHRFTWLLTYELPNPDSMKWLTNGWQMDSSMTISSGNPFNINWGTETFPGDWNSNGEFFGRPDLVGNPFAGTGGRNLVNLSAFAIPCTWDGVAQTCTAGTQHIGNLPRNAFVGPGFRNWDFSMVKNTKLSERVNMQLRADFFNILNHPNFANPLWPNFEIDMTTAGNGLDLTTGRGTGFLAPTVTPDVGLGNPFLGGGGPRDIQLAVRFSF